MTRAARILLLLAPGIVATIAFVACATDGSTDDDAFDPDAGALFPDAAEEHDAAGDAPRLEDVPDTSLPTCSPDGWCYTELPATSALDGGDAPRDPDGFTFPLRAVWAGPDHRALAISARGHVLAWDGATWSVIFVASSPLRTLWAASADDVWIGGDAGYLLHGTRAAGGLTFTKVASGTSYPIVRVWGTSASDVWLLADRAYHRTAESASSATPFVAVDVPSSYGDVTAGVVLSAVWGTAEDTWFGGMESTFCAPPDCVNAKRLFVTRQRSTDAGSSWETVATPVPSATAVVGGFSTASGVEQALVNVRQITDFGFLLRIAGDASKLDARRGPITEDGAFAWNVELAEDFSEPRAIGGARADDVWVVGRSGVVRHFDGVSWSVVRVARSNLSPLVNDLHGIDAFTAGTERETWIVGDDVAMVRRSTP